MSGGKRKSKPTAKTKNNRQPSRGGMPGGSSWSKFLAPMFGRRYAEPDASAAPREPVVIELLSYEITCEPIVDNPADYGLTAEQFERINRVSQELHGKNPARMVATLEKLIDEFPDVPKVWNHLALAYQAAGRHADSERIVQETYHRFPEYLFGITNYGMQRLHGGHPEDIPQILRGTFALHHLQQGRRKYHLSEVRSFFGLLASYFLAIKDPEKAAGYLDMLEELDPEHPLTQMVRSQMLLCLADVMHGGEAE